MLQSFAFLLKKIVSALILPPTSLILLAFVGLWLSKKYTKTGRSLAALSLVILLILSLPLTGNALLQSLETAPPIGESQLKDVQAIVILGGGTDRHAPEFGNEDTVNRWTLQRLRYGAYLQERTGTPILVTGGAPYGGRPEADAMAETLQRDFHAKDIWAENQSKDTAENATYSAVVLKEHNIQRVALISQAWHLPRAIKLFKQQGLTVYPAPTGYTNEDNEPTIRWLPKASALDKSSIAIKEYLGRLSSNGTK
jgi:uncharacterized SAM-binding protein YcdF (DUF218 family)